MIGRCKLRSPTLFQISLIYNEMVDLYRNSEDLGELLNFEKDLLRVR